MSVYRYAATKPGSTQLLRGELSADSPVQVRASLRRMGLLPAEVREVRRRGRVASRDSFFAACAAKLVQRLTRSRQQTQLAEFYESLSALLASGVALTESLELLSSERTGSGKRATLCRHLAESVRGGGGLADAMEQQLDWFGPIDIALTRSAEHSGELDAALIQLASHHGRTDELRNRLIGALAYPALLLVFGIGVVIFLTTRTLPQLASVLESSGGQLPVATRGLLGLGDLLTQQTLILLPMLFAMGVLVAFLAKHHRLASTRLRLPILGTLLKRAQLGQASSLVARLLRGGLPLGQSLELVEPTIPNPVIRQVFVALRSHLAEGGGKVSEAPGLREVDPVFARVIEVGERTGELDETLARIGERYLQSARRLTDRLATLLEPFVILILAAMIGFVVYAAIVPMLQLTQTL